MPFTFAHEFRSPAWTSQSVDATLRFRSCRHSRYNHYSSLRFQKPEFLQALKLQQPRSSSSVATHRFTVKQQAYTSRLSTTVTHRQIPAPEERSNTTPHLINSLQLSSLRFAPWPEPSATLDRASRVPTGFRLTLPFLLSHFSSFPKYFLQASTKPPNSLLTVALQFNYFIYLTVGSVLLNRTKFTLQLL